MIVEPRISILGQPKGNPLIPTMLHFILFGRNSPMMRSQAGIRPIYPAPYSSSPVGRSHYVSFPTAFPKYRVQARWEVTVKPASAG